jgi:hypothetical protein
MKFTEMPITESVTEQVEKMAFRDGAPKGLSFRNRKGMNTSSTMRKNTR